MFWDDSAGLPQVSPVVNVSEGWSFIACEKLCYLHHLLHSFTVQGRAAWTPHSDAAAIDTLSVTQVEGSEDLRGCPDFASQHYSVSPEELESAGCLYLRNVNENEAVCSPSTINFFTYFPGTVFKVWGSRLIIILQHWVV